LLPRKYYQAEVCEYKVIDQKIINHEKPEFNSPVQPCAAQNKQGRSISRYVEPDGDLIECRLVLNIINPDMVQVHDEDKDWFSGSELEHL